MNMVQLRHNYFMQWRAHRFTGGEEILEGM